MVCHYSYVCMLFVAFKNLITYNLPSGYEGIDHLQRLLPRVWSV